MRGTDENSDEVLDETALLVLKKSGLDLQRLREIGDLPLEIAELLEDEAADEKSAAGGLGQGESLLHGARR